MSNLETFGENFYILTDVELGINKNIEDIANIFKEVNEMIAFVEKNNFNLLLKTYFQISVLSMGISSYQRNELLKYRIFLLESCQKILLWMKNISFVKREFLKKEKNKNYQGLTTLYTILYFLVLSKYTRVLKIKDENTYITALIKGYSYASNKVFDDEYDEEIKESILAYKKQRKEEKHEKNFNS